MKNNSLVDIEKSFGIIINRLRDTYFKKNADYGNSFSKSIDEFGKIAFVVRASDKMERMKSLCKSEAKVKDETFKDTVEDLALYCIMYLMEVEDEQVAD